MSPMHPHSHPHSAQAAPELLALLAGQTAAGLPPGIEARQLARGELLSTPGASYNRVFLIVSGRLRVYLAGESRELTLSFLEAGDLYTTHTPTYVAAVQPTTLWLIDTRTFTRQLAEAPEVTPLIMRVLGRLLSNAVQLIEDLAFREVPARLARFLLGLAARRGKAEAGGCCVPLDWTLEDLASLLGTTRQTVSALINQWERAGILARRGRRSLLICSPEALQAYLDPP